MRILVLVISAFLLGRSLGTAQVTPPGQPGGAPTVADNVPQGANWVANARTRVYYSIGCPATNDIPQSDRLYYQNESSLQGAGFTKSEECGASMTPVQRPVVEPTASEVPATNPPATLAAEPERNPRKGFWLNLGFGYGSMGCEACDGRTGSLTGGLALGGALSQKVLLGVGVNGWTKEEFDAKVTVGTLAAVIRFYPSATGGFFLLGGLGLGTIRAEASTVGSATETGVGAVLGLGFDIRLGGNVSLTPFWNGFAANTTTGDANVGELGLGLTIH